MVNHHEVLQGTDTVRLGSGSWVISSLFKTESVYFSRFLSLTQNDESDEEPQEEQQGEDEGQQPLPPAAAGAEPKTQLVFMDR